MAKTQTVEALVEGGKATPAPPLAPALAPLKVNIGQVVADINKATVDFKGMKVPVKIVVNVEDKTYTITVGTPPASQLIMKEINLEKGSGEPHILKVGVISFEQVIKVAKMKQSSLIVNSLKSAVKTIVGSCQSAGIMIDGKSATEILQEIDEGKFDSMINSGITEPSAEKKKKLEELGKELAANVKVRQKEKEAAKAAAEAEAAAKAAAAPAAGATPAPGAVPGAAPTKSATPAKTAAAAAKPAAPAKK